MSKLGSARGFVVLPPERSRRPAHAGLRHLLWAALLGLGCSALPPARAADAAQPDRVTHITWLFGDTLAQRAASGVQRPADSLLDWLEPHLPGIQHHRSVANAKRSWRQIGSGDHVCAASAVRQPDRERLAYFTNTALMPAPQLIVRRERLVDLPRNAAGQVDLTLLLADERWHGARVQGRSYGPQLDALFERAGSPAGLTLSTSADFGSNLLPMLLQKRIDYAFEYPNALVLLARQRPEVSLLEGAAIAGASDPIVVGIACPRTP
jgi:uncharacterized protein (TIGR02285 family)